MRKLFKLFLVISMFAAYAGVSVGAAEADTGHVLTIDDVTVAEGSGGLTVPITVTAHVDPAPAVGEMVKVDFGTSAQAAQGATAKSTAAGDNTPVFDEDFAQTDGTLTFNVTETEKSFTVPVLQDNADEADEIFYVNLFSGRGECVVPDTCTTGASIADPRATITLTDDDATPTLAIDDVTHDEGDDGVTDYTFTVTKTGASAKDVTVHYATADDTATAGSDYTASSGTVTFPKSDTLLPETQTFTVSASRDTTYESNEAFEVNLSDAANATISDGVGIGAITNDDPVPPPGAGVGDAGADEGDAVSFVVTLSSPPGPGQTAVIDWAAAGGTATDGVDFASAVGSVVFTAGETEQTVSVPTTEDVVDELDETFALNLTKPVSHGTGGYTYDLSDASAAGSIADDDAPPTLSVSDVTVVAEGAAEGTSLATFTVTKTGATDREVGVHYATADGTAADGDDYTATSGDLSFAPEDVAKTVDVTVKGDDLDELDETFSVMLSAPTLSTISDGEGVGTITDDDASEVAFAIGDVTVTEGSTGTTDAIFTVTKTGVTGRATSVAFATADDTADAGDDYTAADGSVEFAPAETTKTITVAVTGDDVDEVSSETFFVDLTSPSGGSIAEGEGQGIGTINDDDVPSFSIGDVSVTEGNSGTSTATFTVTRNGGTINTTTVDYATADWSAKKALDYDEVTGTLTFLPADTTKSVAVPVRGDTLDEPNESYTVNLATATGGAAISDASGAGIILDDDAAPKMSIGNDSVIESASKACTVLVKLNAASGRQITANYTTLNGTAGTADYVAKSGTVTFVPGDVAEQIKVFAKGDTKDEPTEKFTIKMSGISPTGAATFTNTSGTCSIIDND